jgi:dihydrofolate reductase
MISLDGFFEGPNQDINWHNVDDEFNDFAIEQLNTADILLFGRVTYQLMAGYWPSAGDDDPIIAEKMNTISKIVFSRTLEKADWNNTRLIKDHIAEEIMKLKQQPGKDLFIFGSADLAVTFIQNNLIDEYRIMISPVILGRGTPMFKDLAHKLNLQLLRAKIFKSGNVLLYYAPAGQ